MNDVIDLLKGKSDEHKFAGLLLATKIEITEELIQQIYEAVGIKFILRLLKSSGSPGDKQDPHCVYKAVAVNILSTFVSSGKVAANESLFKCSKHLISVACNRSMSSSFVDACRCIEFVATFEEGVIELLQNRSLPLLANEFVEREDLNEEMGNALCEALRGCWSHGPPSPQVVENTIELLISAFVKKEDIVKFVLLQLLATIFEQVPEFLKDTHNQLPSLRAAINKILSSRIGGGHRISCLHLISSLNKEHQHSWLLSFKDGGNFLSLITSLCKVELRMRLEEPQLSADANTVVPICCNVIESVIESLLSDEAEKIPGKFLVNIQENLVEIFGAICFYLSELGNEKKYEDELGFSCGRLLSCWLAFDSPVGIEHSILEKSVIYLAQMQPESSRMQMIEYTIAALHQLSEEPMTDDIIQNPHVIAALCLLLKTKGNGLDDTKCQLVTRIFLRITLEDQILASQNENFQSTAAFWISVMEKSTDADNQLDGCIVLLRISTVNNSSNDEANAGGIFAELLGKLVQILEKSFTTENEEAVNEIFDLIAQCCSQSKNLHQAVQQTHWDTMCNHHQSLANQVARITQIIPNISETKSTGPNTSLKELD